DLGQPNLDMPNLDMNGEDPGTTPLPDANDPAFQDKGAYGSMNTDGPLPDFLKEEPKPDPKAPSVFEGLKTPKIGG
ncbi:hypothetical protein, partial [Rhizobium sp.]|uniref:hypothetical protein n=1 Tax=Rhizobium sp. TaxID=391 RepID=UPI002AA7F246